MMSCGPKQISGSRSFLKSRSHIMLNTGMILLFALSCSKYHSRRRSSEPINIAVIDESRVENTKIRHIFKEFLIKEIINEGKGTLNVFNTDAPSDESIEFKHIDYFISFDIMDYGIFDIDRNMDKLLVSAKIVKLPKYLILNSSIEAVEGNKIKKMCEEVANRLANSVVRRLLSIHVRTDSLPNVLEEPQDSSLTDKGKK